MKRVEEEEAKFLEKEFEFIESEEMSEIDMHGRGGNKQRTKGIAGECDKSKRFNLTFTYSAFSVYRLLSSDFESCKFLEHPSLKVH